MAHRAQFVNSHTARIRTETVAAALSSGAVSGSILPAVRFAKKEGENET